MLNRLPASSWRPWRVLAASLLFVNFLLAMGLMNSLLEDNSPSNTVPTSVSDVPGALTIGMLVRNRPDYLVTMPLFMQKLTPGVDHAIVIDMGSNPPLAPLNTTATQPKVDFKLLRVESDAFQMNRALALLLEHTQSETVLLMDNDCYPVGIDLKQRSVRLMYPTVYRFFMTNVMVPRSALVAFVNILPLRLLDDSKSFEGLDQIWAWYFGLEMAPLGLVRHVGDPETDDMLQQVHDKTYAGDHVYTWRIFLWLNRFGEPHLTPVAIVCTHIPPLCNETLLSTLRAPLVYRVLDTLFSIKILWWGLLVLQYFTMTTWLTVLVGLAFFFVFLPLVLDRCIGRLALYIGLKTIVAMTCALLMVLSVAG